MAQDVPQPAPQFADAGSDRPAPQGGDAPKDGDRSKDGDKKDKDRDDKADLERARAAARAADIGDDGIDRARAAARATDPRFEGLEKARESARATDSGGGTDCLSASEARKAIQARKAVPLADAVRAARDAMKGEVIDYRLCTYDGHLAYQLTLLKGDGKVIRARVEAVDGKLVGVK